MKLALTVALLGACSSSESDTTPAPATPTERPATSTVRPAPPAPAPAQVATPAVVTLVPRPFAHAELARATSSPYAKGRFERHTVRTGRNTTVWGHLGTTVVLAAVTGKARPTSWELVDRAGRSLGSIGRPTERLSETELVVSVDNHHRIVHPDGTAIIPIPELPDKATAKVVMALAAADAPDVFLVAETEGHAYVGAWNDRSATPRLATEIPLHALELGWFPRRIPDGIELTIDERPGEPSQPCGVLRLHRNAAPECLTGEDAALARHGESASVVSGSWSVAVDSSDRDHPSLVAVDSVTKRRETIALTGMPTIAWSSFRTPRVIVLSGGQLIAWTPNRALAIASPGRGLARHRPSASRARLLASFTELVEPVGEDWIDLDAGVQLHGPVLRDLLLGRGPRFVAIEGTGRASRAVLVDVDKKTLADIAPTPCVGRLLADLASDRLVILSCGREDRPGYFDFAHVWTKVVDIVAERVYELPGVVETLLADDTIIMSNRTRIPGGEAMTTSTVIEAIELR